MEMTGRGGRRLVNEPAVCAAAARPAAAASTRDKFALRRRRRRRHQRTGGSAIEARAGSSVDRRCPTAGAARAASAVQ